MFGYMTAYMKAENETKMAYTTIQFDFRKPITQDVFDMIAEKTKEMYAETGVIMDKVTFCTKEEYEANHNENVLFQKSWGDKKEEPTFLCPRCGETYYGLDFIETGDCDGTFEMVCDSCELALEIEFDTIFIFKAREHKKESDAKKEDCVKCWKCEKEIDSTLAFCPHCLACM